MIGKVKLIVFTILVIHLMGCGGARVTVTSVAQAEVLDLKSLGVDSITVIEIRDPRITDWGLTSGGVGRQMTGLIQSGFLDTGSFEVIDRTDMRTIQREHKFNMSGWVDEDIAADALELKGSKVILVSEIHKYGMNQVLRTNWVSGQAYHRREGLALIQMTAKVVDIQSGKVLAIVPIDIIRNLNNPLQGYSGSVPPKYDVRIVMTGLRTEAATKIVSSLSQHKVKYAVTLETDSNIPELEIGNRFAAIGEWEDAKYEYSQAAKANPDSPRVFHNLGIANRVTGDLVAAEQNLKKAYKLKPDKKYLLELQRNKQFIIKP